MGWFVGFDGHFSFGNIGDSYTENHVPYVGMRALPAILGGLTVPVVYAIMKETGYSTVVAAFSASIILFGAYIFFASIAPASELVTSTQTMHTLRSLDSFFSMLPSYSSWLSQSTHMYDSVNCVTGMSDVLDINKIYRADLCHREFSAEWWSWLIATGFFMACTWGSKVNGILTVITIGIAVLIDLWGILDYRRGHTMVGVFVSPREPFGKSKFLGAFLEAFCGSGNRLDCRPIHHIPLILLCPLCYLDSFGPWRHIHEPRFPGDAHW